MQIVDLVIKDILKTIEKYFIHALFFAVILFALSFIVKMIGKSTKKCKGRKYNRVCVKNGVETFCLNMYFYFIFDITILSREWFRYEPFFDVMGGWRIRDYGNGRIGCDPIENIIFFVPYGLLLYKKFYVKKQTNTIKRVAFVCLCTSVLIEVLQMITGAGTLQIADLLYNTIGGFIGCMVCKIFVYIRDNKHKDAKLKLNDFQIK